MAARTALLASLREQDDDDDDDDEGEMRKNKITRVFAIQRWREGTAIFPCRKEIARERQMEKDIESWREKEGGPRGVEISGVKRRRADL